MKFLMTYAATNRLPPTPEHLAAIGKFGKEMTEAGVLLMTGGLQKKGTKLRYAGGQHTVTDGPYAETKELIDGFALVEAKSVEEALAVARRFMQVAGEGEAEVQQVFEGPNSPR